MTNRPNVHARGDPVGGGHAPLTCSIPKLKLKSHFSECGCGYVQAWRPSKLRIVGRLVFWHRGHVRVLRRGRSTDVLVSSFYRVKFNFWRKKFHCFHCGGGTYRRLSRGDVRSVKCPNCNCY